MSAVLSTLWGHTHCLNLQLLLTMSQPLKQPAASHWHLTCKWAVLCFLEIHDKHLLFIFQGHFWGDNFSVWESNTVAKQAFPVTSNTSPRNTDILLQHFTWFLVCLFVVFHLVTANVLDIWTGFSSARSLYISQHSKLIQQKSHTGLNAFRAILHFFFQNKPQALFVNEVVVNPKFQAAVTVTLQ